MSDLFDMSLYFRGSSRRPSCWTSVRVRTSVMSDVRTSTDVRRFCKVSVKARASSSPSMSDVRNVSDVRSPAMSDVRNVTDVRSPSALLLLLELGRLLLEPCLLHGT